MLGDLILIFLAAAGVVFLLWCLLGLLLAPVFGPEMTTLCFASGGGGGLERRARAYGWLRDGRVTGGRLVIVDCGLTEEGRTLVHALRERWPWVEYCAREDLAAYIAAQ